jgi:hypothetical protein
MLNQMRETIMNSVLLWVELHKTLVTATTSIVVTLLTLGGGLLVGQKLTAKWNLRVKEREADLAAIQRLRELYGELLTIQRSWKQHFPKDIMVKLDGRVALDDRGSKLLDHCSSLEGEIEGIMMKIAYERALCGSEIDRLGLARQAYQQPRECIRNGERVPWDSSEQPHYLVFKLGIQEMIRILYLDRRNAPARQFERITSNDYEPIFRKITRKSLNHYWQYDTK